VQWEVKVADALVEAGEVLVCPANVFLNLSGGVGGEILLRHGDGMQKELHEWLARSGRKFVQRGEVVVSGGWGTGFRAVMHAVAVDGMYETSAEVVEGVVDAALRRAGEVGAKTVVLTAVGTGFGRLSMGEFARGVSGLRARAYPPVERVVVCVRKERERGEVERVWGSTA
jgi:O-acetyl-ADP-ribose deacetylase